MSTLMSLAVTLFSVGLFAKGIDNKKPLWVAISFIIAIVGYSAAFYVHQHEYPMNNTCKPMGVTINQEKAYTCPEVKKDA